MKRKLPVYILIDTSGSMSGEPIEAVNNGSKLLIRALRKDPQALETVEISFIEFNSKASLAIPLTPIAEIQEPNFSASGGTSMGAALDILAESIRNDVNIGDVKLEQKGDYKPLVFLLTDGYPTDGWEAAIDRFDKKKINFIVSCGVPGANRSVLEKISGPEFVIELDSANEQDLARFFQWVTQSIQSASVSVPNSADEDISMNSLPAIINQEEAEFF